MVKMQNSRTSGAAHFWGWGCGYIKMYFCWTIFFFFLYWTHVFRPHYFIIQTSNPIQISFGNSIQILELEHLQQFPNNSFSIISIERCLNSSFMIIGGVIFAVFQYSCPNITTYWESMNPPFIWEELWWNIGMFQ